MLITGMPVPLDTASILMFDTSTSVFKPHLSYSDRFLAGGGWGGTRLLNVTVQMSKGSESAKELGEAED